MTDSCGAKTRAGGECKKPPLKCKTRCRLHGGLSSGAGQPARPGNGNALKHGIYGDLLRPDEIEVAERVGGAVGKVEDELLIARMQLRRALKAQAHADSLPDGMEVFETVEREGAEAVSARSEVKSKLRDYPQIIDRLMARIESLEKTRAVLKGESPAAGDDMLRDDTTIAPDEAIPRAPIL